LPTFEVAENPKQNSVISAAEWLLVALSSEPNICLTGDQCESMAVILKL